MSPEHARMYAYVHPLFWGWLWLQLQWFTSWQKQSHRPLLVAVTRWGNLYTVQIGDKVTTYRKPEAVKPSWDDPVWESALPPNMVGVFQEDSKTPLSGTDLLPRLRGLRGTSVCTANAPRRPGGAEGGAPNDTS